MKKLFLVLISIFFCISCATSSSSSNAGKNWWKEIIWDQVDGGMYSDFEFIGLTPSCSNSPESATNDFSFFVKEGEVDKMVVYFQGGGACWHYNNCIVQPEYFGEKLFLEQVVFMDMMSNQDSLALALDYGGIFNFVNEDNPFKDWHFIYIPYCTADLHAGAVDTEYTNGTDTAEIRHRGNVNFQFVLQWIKDNYDTDPPEEIFMTGMSGGSYGSIFNFPYVKESFPNAKMYHLGDSGNGVLHEDFQKNGISNWSIQIPVPDGIRLPVSSTFPGFTDDLTIYEVYSTIANFYNGDTFAQITTAWDGIQTFFYNVMANIDNPGSEGENWDDYLSVWCHWNSELYNNIDATLDPVTGITADNYRYFISPGKRHTVLMSNVFYTETSDGISLVEWIEAMLAGSSDFVNVECTGDCGKPEECPACP